MVNSVVHSEELAQTGSAFWIGLIQRYRKKEVDCIASAQSKHPPSSVEFIMANLRV